jgi:micrococcal nuclease
MRILGCAAATALLLLAATVTRAEEFRGVDPKQVVDGDNFYVSIRLSGIDAPEEGNRAKCDQERALAKRAEARMKELLHGLVTLDIQDVDEFGRLLANVRLHDGRDLGQVLLGEGLARPYEAGRRPSWC